MQLVINMPKELYKRIPTKEYIGYMDMSDWQKIIMSVSNGTPLPKGHGKLIDADVLCDYFWDNRSKLYTHKDLQIVIDNAPTIIEANTAESEDASGAEITDAYPADWKTVLYCDIEHNCAISKAQLFNEYKAMVDAGTIDSDETFSDYLANCTSKNGTLVRLQ